MVTFIENYPKFKKVDTIFKHNTGKQNAWFQYCFFFFKGIRDFTISNSQRRHVKGKQTLYYSAGVPLEGITVNGHLLYFLYVPQLRLPNRWGMQHV